jgi:hypothetical protein
LLTVVRRHVGCHGDDDGLTGFTVVGIPDNPRHLVTVQAGHLAVHQNEIVDVLLHRRQNRRTVLDRIHFQVQRLQHAAQHVAVERVVLGNQYAQRSRQTVNSSRRISDIDV